MSSSTADHASDAVAEIAWTDKVATSKELGLPAVELFVISSKPVAGMGPVMQAFDEHLRYQKDLEDREIMFAAGPVVSDDGERWDGDGLFVYRTSSEDEARKIAKQDPMHKQGARTFEIRTWCLNEGTSTKTL